MVYVQHRRVAQGFGAMDGEVHRRADHALGQLAGGGLLRVHRADAVALAEDGDAVGDVQHLVELVGDDDDGAALVAHLAKDGEEAVDLLRGKHGGGLVQHQRARAAVKHLEDLHGLLLADGEGVDLARGVDVQAKAVAQIADLAGELLAAGVVARGAQHDVVLHGKHVHELEVLMDHADAQGDGVVRGADMHFLAVHADMPRVRPVDAGEHVHQRSLAGAVFAQQRQYLAIVHGQVDVLVGDDGAEGLGQPLQLDRRMSPWHAHHSLKGICPLYLVSRRLGSSFGQISAKKWRFYVFPGKTFAIKRA